jgi:hypothetical protein
MILPLQYDMCFVEFVRGGLCMSEAAGSGTLVVATLTTKISINKFIELMNSPMIHL